MLLHRLWRCVAHTIALVFVICVWCLPSISECPKCGYNYPPRSGPPAEDGSGRRQLVIKVDTSSTTGWGNPTNEQVWNGTVDARNDWVNATDGNNPPNKTGYYLKLDQTTNNPDIVIKKGAVQGGCASVNLNTTPIEITLPENICDFDSTTIAGRIKHEFSHPQVL